MPRRREIPKREILPDPVYNSTLVAKFINAMMWDGKRSVAEGILYKSLSKIQDRTGEDALKVFKKAIENPSRRSRSSRSGSVAPTTKFLSKSPLHGERPSPCDGSSAMPAAAVRRR